MHCLETAECRGLQPPKPNSEAWNTAEAGPTHPPAGSCSLAHNGERTRIGGGEKEGWREGGREETGDWNEDAANIGSLSAKP